MLALGLLVSAQHCILMPFHLSGKAQWQRSFWVGIYSLELRGSVSNNWEKDVIDLNASEITEWEAHLSSWKSCYTFYWIASLHTRPDTMGLSLPCIHSLAEDGNKVDMAVRFPALSYVVWGGRNHAWDAESLIQGYPSPAFQQHSIYVKNWSKFILISLYVLLGNEFWMGQEVGCSDDHCLCSAPTTSTTALSHPSISGREVSVYHTSFCFIFYLPL